ncbi:ECF transporter S component [Robertmurraya kyonggiensis]|uniref:ECF transporter S component n=1 Tax=Robertmurraya kyonggiensis TaxID=1037680 RepID=A0A4U1CYB5_9BACI|nr:ECF transporter S component [Robertmurraya kyonggiensis]TKC14841.1 ECF transporter S component [Robertmurraya kyonggiensis]
MNGKKISLLALFIGISVVGASLKIPAIIGSVALDAFPALLAATFFGGGAGAIVAGVGHMISALLGGMPMGPLHFVVAVEMALLALLFAYTWKRKWLASVLFIFGNAILAPIPFIYIYDWAFYVALVPSLLIGSIVNTAVALLLISRIQHIFTRGVVKG